jgi:thiol-disulfide isomerase/thioredoxin
MKLKTAIIMGFLAMVLLSLTGCPSPPPNPDNNTTSYFDDYVIKKDGNLPILECNVRKLSGKVLVFHAAHCGACKIAVPILQELEQELNMTFKYYDLDVEEDAAAVRELKLVPYYTPTVIINCKVLIGAKEKGIYKEELEKMLAAQ